MLTQHWEILGWHVYLYGAFLRVCFCCCSAVSVYAYKTFLLICLIILLEDCSIYFEWNKFHINGKTFFKLQHSYISSEIGYVRRYNFQHHIVYFSICSAIRTQVLSSLLDSGIYRMISIWYLSLYNRGSERRYNINSSTCIRYVNSCFKSRLTFVVFLAKYADIIPLESRSKQCFTSLLILIFEIFVFQVICYRALFYVWIYILALNIPWNLS